MVENTEQKNNIGIKDVFEWLESFVISLIAVIFIFTFIFGKVEVSGNSMNQTLFNGDQLIITGWNYTPAVGDIVILSKGCSDTEIGKIIDDKPLVKRIVAIEGQSVEIKESHLFVDGKMIDEEYEYGNTYSNGFEGKQVVPKDCVFVLGDNREDSSDSRVLGFINKSYIMGKVLCRAFPFENITAF